MKIISEVEIKKSKFKITHKSPVLLVGSCFTSNMGNYLKEIKIPVAINPSGILFDPFSICRHLDLFISEKELNKGDLELEEDLYYNFDFHSQFNDINAESCLEKINSAIKLGTESLKKAKFLILTLGSAYCYYHKKKEIFVANCHKVSQKEFNKTLAGIENIRAEFIKIIQKIKEINPELVVIFTISPVRHLRDGIIENSRSKARLIELVHQLVEEFEHVKYFPSYEIIMDELRDYRWYDIDLAHPNFAATEYIKEKFFDAYLDKESIKLGVEFQKIKKGINHRPLHAESKAHQKFIQELKEKIKNYHQKYPDLDWEEELDFVG